MKIAIATVQVPFIKGGAELLVKMLKTELIRKGHETEIISIPFRWYPPRNLFKSILMGRMMDIHDMNGDKIDLVIAMKFPAYYVKHDNKVIWLMHQHRQAYDLWQTKFGDLHLTNSGWLAKKIIEKLDKKYISEARNVFTISKNSSKRLKGFNKIHATPLYHPPLNHEKLHCKKYGDFIFYASRIDAMKRQRVLVESAKYIKSNTKIYIAGSGSKYEIDHIKGIIKRNKLQKKVKLLGFIREEEKIKYYANCLGVYFGSYDEDYGYITLEAFFSKKPVIIHHDAGGPTEFVKDGKNGYVISTDPKEIAKKIDMLSCNKKLAKRLGHNGFQTLKDKKISWDHVIDKLLKK